MLTINESLCIASTVSKDHVLLTANDFCEYIDSVKINIDYKHYETVIGGLQLMLILSGIEQFLDRLLIGREAPTKDKFTPIVSLFYNTTKIDLNYKNRKDWMIGSAISCYEIINETISKNGSVYIFNRGYINKYGSDKIVARLKHGVRMDLNQLLAEVEHYNKNSNEQVNRSSLLVGVQHLQELGYLDVDQKGSFALTLKGELLVL